MSLWIKRSRRKEVTEIYARLGLTVEDAIRIFLRRSVRAGALPFPMRCPMIEADEEVRKFLATRQGLPVYKTPQEAFETLDRL